MKIDESNILEARSREIFENNGSILLLVEPKSGRIVDANPAALSFYGYSRDHLKSMTLSQINVLGWEQIAQERKQALYPERNFFNFRHRLASGEERDVEIFFSPIGGGETPLLFSIVHDITGFKQAQQELRNSQGVYQATFQTTTDAMAITRLRDGLFIDTSRAFLDMMGYSREEVIGRTSVELNIWSSPRERERMRRAAVSGSVSYNPEFEMRRKNGEKFAAHISISKMEIDGTDYLLTVWKDISALKKAEEKIKNLAFFDPLTQLPNRDLLLDRIEQAQFASIRDELGMALLLVDLDNFKALNDTLGRNACNALLKEVGNRIAECIRKTDTVARLGADEYGVLVGGLGKTQDETATIARHIADNICAALKRPFLLEGHDCMITASIGIKVFEDAQQGGAMGLLERAENALHQAKAQGRGGIQFFSPAMHASTLARVSLEGDFRTATIEEQFLLLYQPQVDATGLVGVEALVRWNHPRRGVVDPFDFIPLAEETGLILPLGDWVLEAACKQIVAWQQNKVMAGISIAVNISAHQFRQADFVEQVLAVIERTGADPSKLKMELTETTFLEGFEDVIVKMRLLKSHGLRFSMDDFGTGYSSLAYLKRLPLDQLKIDRAFVRDILDDVASGAIAQTIISLGKTMGLSVIAEGVESEEQRDFLIGLGCHSFQGYLFSPPLTSQEIEAWQMERIKMDRIKKDRIKSVHQVPR